MAGLLLVPAAQAAACEFCCTSNLQPLHALTGAGNTGLTCGGTDDRCGQQSAPLPPQTERLAIQAMLVSRR